MVVNECLRWTKIKLKFIWKRLKNTYQQESPPVWTQEAYRPPCSEYSFCCPNWVPPPPSWPGWGGTLPGGYPTWVPPLPCPNLVGGYPAGEYPGPDPGGYPAGGYPTWVPPCPDLAGYPLSTGPCWVPPPRCLSHGILGNAAQHYGIWVPPQWLPRGILGNVAKHYGIWVPPGGQTDRHVSKHYLSRRTTYAGVIKYGIIKVKETRSLVTILCHKAALEMMSLDWMFWIFVSWKAFVTNGWLMEVPYWFFERVFNQTFENL